MESTKTMELEVLSYERLKAQDHDEVQKMVRVLSNEGLFFLDMRGPSAKDLLADLQPIIQHQRRFFDETAGVKSKYRTDFRFKGYIPSDIGVELLRLSREEHIRGTLDLPEALQPVAAKVASTSGFVDAVLRDVGTTLCKAMDPPVAAAAAVLDAERPGDSYLTLAISRARAGTCLVPSHADEGFLTLTFYDEPFLEVLDRATHEWRLVPVHDHEHHMPIVNVAEELQRRSNGRLHAPLHRVEQGRNEIDLVMYDLYESPRTGE